MTLSDAGLSSFATGLLSASGAIFAVSTTIWIFVFDRRSQDQGNALKQVQQSSSNLYDFLVVNSTTPGNYVVSLASYNDFARIISQIYEPHSVTSVPDYISWRRDTSEIIEKSQEFGREIQAAILKIQSGESSVDIDMNKYNFHNKFVGFMHGLDLAIQELDWVIEVRKSGVKHVTRGIGMSVVVFLAAILVALASNMASVNGIDDVWNFFSAALLTAGIAMVCFFLIRAFMVNELSREDWIQRRFKQVQKELMKDRPSNG